MKPTHTCGAGFIVKAVKPAVHTYVTKPTLLLLLLLGSNEVVDNRQQEDGNTNEHQSHAVGVVDDVTKDDSHPREVCVREGRAAVTQCRKYGHADSRQEGNEQAVYKSTSYATLDASFGITKDASRCATGIVALMPPRINRPTIPPIKELIKPMVTAFGA